MVIVQLWVGYKRLEDVIADRGFFHVSEIGPNCDVINVCVETVLDLAPVANDCQIIAEEFSEGPCTEAALQPGSI